MHTLYTFGYQGVDRAAFERMVAARKLLVADIRFRPYSRAAEWNQKALLKALGERYVYLGDLGNANYNGVEGDEIRIVDQAKGLEALRQRLIKEDVLLLCACWNVATCHRLVVAEAAQSTYNCSLQHLTKKDLPPPLPPPVEQLRMF